MNRKTSKRALGLSFVSMLLCITMLMGTTFAWFTDNATVAVNTIQAGVIDIRLVDPVTGVDMEDKELKFVNKNDGTDILWEPGVTFSSQPIRVMNHSNLSFYLDVFINGFTGDMELLDAIEFKIVYASSIVEGYTWDQLNGRGHLMAGTGTSLTGEGKNGNNWMAPYYGLQSDRTAEDEFLGGYLGYAIDPSKLTAGTAKPLFDICIVGHMKEEAGNQYQGKKLTGAALTFRATQSPYEYDSYEFVYDSDAEFAEIEKGIVVSEGSISVPAGENLVIKGGNVDSYKLIESSGEGVVINNVDFVGNAVIWGEGGLVTINGGTFTAWAIAVGDAAPAPVVINGGTFNLGDGGIDADTGVDVTINGGTFNVDPTNWLGEGKTAVNNCDGTWTVK